MRHELAPTRSSAEPFSRDNPSQFYTALAWGTKLRFAVCGMEEAVTDPAERTTFMVQPGKIPAPPLGSTPALFGLTPSA
jgi:hypothetical protein